MPTPAANAADRVEDLGSESSTSAVTLSTRCEMACDAVGREKPFAGDAVRHYLVSLAASLDRYALHEPANGLLDVKVVEAIDHFLPSLKEWRGLLTAVATCADPSAHMPAVLAFFRNIIGYKSAVSQEQYCVLWSDQYRYLVRELFLTAVGIFMRHRQWDAVAQLVSAEYGDDKDTAQRFTVFDGYAKTLDEFRNRRLQLHRMSVSSDIMRDRVDVTQCDFEGLMQADFVLCLRSLVCEPNFFVRWYPRTLVYADHFAVNGFDQFVTASDPARFEPLAKMLSVADWDDLMTRFEAVYRAWDLVRWELAGAPLDFHGYMGLRNPALPQRAVGG